MGDEIATLDPATLALSSTRVTRVVVAHLREEYFEVNGELHVTGDHPVFVARGRRREPTRVDQLEVGMRLVAPVGEVAVRSITRVRAAVRTAYVETEAGTLLVRAGDRDYLVVANYAGREELKDARRRIALSHPLFREAP